LATKLRWNSNTSWFNNETHELSSKHLLVLRTTAGHTQLRTLIFIHDYIRSDIK
jgi:hypothetical protein